MDALLSFDLRDEALRDQGIALVETLSDEKLRVFGLRRIVAEWAETQSLDSMGEWLDLREAASSEERIALERAAAGPHIRRDPEASAKWLIERATPQSLPGHLESVVSGWAGNHPAACAEWLSGLERGPETDLAVASFAKTISRDDHESSFLWAQEIGDDALRYDTARTVLKVWERTEPGAARQFLNESELQSEERDSLLEILR